MTTNFAKLNRWNNILISLVGVFVLHGAQTASTVILPQMMKCEFNGCSSLAASFAVIAPLIIACTVVIWGRVADRIGIKKTIQIGCLFSAVGYLGNAISSGMSSMFIFRAIGGLGDSMLLCSVLTALVLGMSPKIKNRLLGFYNSFSSIGTVAGALLGGYCCHHISWRAVFLMPVPMFLVMFLLTLVWHPITPRGLQKMTRPDYIGAILLFMWLSLLATWLICAGDEIHWHSPFVIATVVLAIMFFSIWYVFEASYSHPLMNVNLFRDNQILQDSLILIVVTSIFVGGIKFFVPLYLAQSNDYTSIQIGWLMIAYAIARIVGSPLAGTVADRGNADRVLRVGVDMFFLAFASLLIWCDMGNNFAAESVFFGFLIVSGIGTSFVLPAATARLMVNVPKQFSGMMAGCYQMFNVVGNVIGIGAFECLYSTGNPSVGCEHIALLAAVVCVFCLTFAFHEIPDELDAAISETNA